jgi:hypothetical protein
MLEPEFWFWLLIAVSVACLPTVALVLIFSWRNRRKKDEPVKDWLESSFKDAPEPVENPDEPVSRARRWLEQGNYTEAMGVLEQLPVDAKSEVPVLKLRCRAYRSVADWDRVAECAGTAVDIYPQESWFWVWWAWAEHKLGRTETALQIISMVTDRFPDHEAVAYCYCCLFAAMRRTAEARVWLSKAMECSAAPEKVRLKALAQPEFDSIWLEVVARSIPQGTRP